MNEHNDKYLQIDVSGKNPDLFKKMREKLLTAVNSFLDTTIHHTDKTSIKQEAQKFKDLALDYGKNKLKKSGLENEKLAAEIEETYSQSQLNLAEARVKNAEADAIEFDNATTKMLFKLKMTKVIMAGSSGEEEMFFVKQIDDFIEVVNAYKSGQQSLK